MDEQLRRSALHYHRYPSPGKLSINATKGLTNQRDLALAYSPGVAAACEEIVADPSAVDLYTSRANLIGVVTNGSAVLGLGAIGPLAAKPVMEGKAVLFKKFAGIDVFDLEINEDDEDQLIKIIASLEPTFGGINLEDIKAPECFRIEKELRKRLKIPVFHDDQHGTSIIVAAAFLNALEVVGKDLKDVKVVCSGAGAAALACLELLVQVGLPIANIYVADIHGVVYQGREVEMDEIKAQFAKDTDDRNLADLMVDADVFIGLSAANVLNEDMITLMSKNPVILALANPDPEIHPDIVHRVRPDAVMATGRSDYPNQVNNVLCFPFIFRGALDVGATEINDEMKLAAVRAIAELAREEQSDVVAMAYENIEMKFGPTYFIPKPFDPRLIVRIAPAVADAAMKSGVATRPILDFEAYKERLTQFVYHSGIIMKPVFLAAKQKPQRVVYCEGEDERVLRAVQIVVDEGLARPILIARPEVLENKIEKAGLRIRPHRDFELFDPNSDPRIEGYWKQYYEIMQRKGVSEEYANREASRRTTLIGALMVNNGDADAMLCGTIANFDIHLRHIDDVIGLRRGVSRYAAMNVLILPGRTIFICDTYVNINPDAEQIADITILAAEEVRRFGLVPNIALLSHSNFGTSRDISAQKMSLAREMIIERDPTLKVEGEMHGDAALDEQIRQKIFPNSQISGEANLLIMPNLDAANISFNLMKVTAGEGITIGPILLGPSKVVHVLTPTATVRRLVNMSALCSVDATTNR
ncbi:MAG: NADP-dependent malic enzyme [Burkholderiales bacterium]|jgi:malate dehydrogenase (oxaloacetate-decarboxylating)(NADP+)|nr:NADP-dependent malic enzyme [Pseudomonadota bacterium]MDA1011823.1 NADP-dependent malic enzyme [Pseudomonadota bacterium]|tara:strand:+ start:9026 stop:11299 length:2274 start_codon:yes stop_codon:yes gene_type:complete